jgi:hypothetical protein
MKKLQNWKAPGPDKIHNFWWKHLPSSHSVLAKQLSYIITNQKQLPLFLMKGITYLIPKNEKIDDPKNYRPITCLSTLYKLITAVLSNLIYSHITENNILSEEQKGCRLNAMGCKEQLLIDQIICNIVRCKTRSLSTSWIDYAKAFDSVPHSWLIKVLHLYCGDRRLVPQ